MRLGWRWYQQIEEMGKRRGERVREDDPCSQTGEIIFCWLYQVIMIILIGGMKSRVFIELYSPYLYISFAESLLILVPVHLFVDIVLLLTICRLICIHLFLLLFMRLGIELLREHHIGQLMVQLSMFLIHYKFCFVRIFWI